MELIFLFISFSCFPTLFWFVSLSITIFFNFFFFLSLSLSVSLYLSLSLSISLCLSHPFYSFSLSLFLSNYLSLSPSLSLSLTHSPLSFSIYLTIFLSRLVSPFLPLSLAYIFNIIFPTLYVILLVQGLAYNFRVVNSGLVQTVADHRLPDTKVIYQTHTLVLQHLSIEKNSRFCYSDIIE